jgi:hypothetical protein
VDVPATSPLKTASGSRGIERSMPSRLSVFPGVKMS